MKNMEYREMKHGEKVSLLGFGCMRFPLHADGSICEKEAEAMLDEAIAHGVNYIDTAYPYHNGDSEPFVGRVLKKYDRESFYLATKLPIFKIDSLDDAKRIFEEQLQRLDISYVDFYLLHAMNKDTWEKAKNLGILDYLDDLKKAGKIHNLGFSFHDEYEVFEEMINARDWDFTQIQYNYIDREIQAGDKGYQLCVEKQIPMVVMEPVKGGNLAVLPKDLADIFQQKHPDKSISSWALRWVGTHQNVRVILSGMSLMEQVKDNLETFDVFEPLCLEEEQLVENVAKMIQARTKNGCTACKYCMPCPFGIDIPGNFKIWNEYAKYGNEQATSKKLARMDEKARFDQCQKCGRCESLCPQHIAIRDDLEKMKKDLAFFK